MVVKIRLARFGKRHAPLYNIVVAHARTARDSRPLEVLGTWDPKPHVPLASNDPPPPPSKLQDNIDPSTSSSYGAEPPVSASAKPRRYKSISLDTSRTKYWLGVGAQPSEPVQRLLSLLGLIEPKPGKVKSPRD